VYSIKDKPKDFIVDEIINLNLDGGGTAAMYINGGYVVGPGRPLANAVVLVR